MDRDSRNVGVPGVTQPEPWEWPALEPEIRAALAVLVDRELATRCFSGALVYFGVVLALVFSTDYEDEHPWLMLAAAILTLANGSLRMLAARQVLRSPPSAAAKRTFFTTTYVTFLIWGLFCAWTIHLYPGGWTGMFALLSGAALAAGATSSLAPSFTLAWRCLALLAIPSMISTAAIGDRRHWALAVVITLYLIFLIAQTKGNWRWFLGSAIAAEREKLRGSVDRKRAEQERMTLMTAMEQAAEEILITDVDGQIQYCNRAFERITGYSRAEVLGKNPRFLKSGKHPPEFYEELWKTVRSGRVWTGRLINRNKSGALYEVDGSISPIVDSSAKLTGFVAARRDVTERLKLESELRQAQKMESIGRLAGGVAHDFNNLLTVILGFSDVLGGHLEQQPRLVDYVNGIRNAAERAASLTQQLLAFSRKQLIQPAPVNLNTLIEDFRQMLQSLIGEDVEIETDLQPELGTVLADPGQMNQILMNLGANARDAMPNGGKLVIRTANVNGPELNGLSVNRSVVLSFTDNGSGFDESTRARIFEPFFTTKEHGTATGLGLATVYGIVKQSGGSIEVQSEPGKGATFQISLPRLDDSQIAAPPSGLVGGELHGTEMVLVVDDQDNILKLLNEVLEAFGYDVMLANGGQDAVDLGIEYDGPIDLLVTDVMMPDLTGPEVAAQLREAHPEMKVLYISGHSGEEIAKHGVLNPGVSYLPKPFSPRGLAQKVRQVLDICDTNE